MLDLAVVLPCLNEAENLRGLLPRIQQVLSEIPASSAVYVIDGGSTDDTPGMARALGAAVIIQRGSGYGGAIKTAFEDIRATYLLTMDADFSHHPGFIKYLYARRDQAEIVIASRHAPQGYAEMAWTRRVLSGALNLVFRRLLGMETRDLSSGFRLYRRTAVARLELQYETYAVLQEILVKAYCQGYRVIEEPFHYLPRRHGATHARLIQFGIAYLKALRALWLLRNGIQSADYDTRAFYSVIPLQRWWQRQRYRILLEFIGDRQRVLDVGCGSSQLLNGAPQSLGVDIMHAKLRFMRRSGRDLVNADGCALPFRDEVFEAAVLSEVIAYVSEPSRMLAEITRCLRPGGVLLVGVPDYGRRRWRVIGRLRALILPRSDAKLELVRYTRETLTRLLAEHGCAVADHRYIWGAELIVTAKKLPCDSD